MRTYNDREKQIIAQLLDAASPGLPLRMDEILGRCYFREASGRALIIQNRGEYAVFFLKTALFNDKAIRESETKYFFELIALLVHLKDSGYITLVRSENEKMYYMQDGFDAPEISGSRIILNKKGDYTSSPDTIHNSKGEVIYNGILFRSYRYSLIVNTATGSWTVSDTIGSLLKDHDMETTNETPSGKGNIPTVDPPKSKRIWKYLLNIFLLLGVNSALVGIYHLYSRMEHADKRMEQAESYLAPMDKLRFDVDSLRHTAAFSATKDTARLPSKTYRGIDISRYNRDEASTVMPGDSITFVICKATDGARRVDTYFKENWKDSRNKGFLLGAYHAYRIKDHPSAQADFFRKTVASQGQADIAPIVNIEEESLAGSAQPDPEKIQQNLLIFLKKIEAESSRKPIVYTNRYFANKYLVNEQLSLYPLWLADCTRTEAPILPLTWKTTGYLIRQKRYNYFSDLYGEEETEFDTFTGDLRELAE
ncbi:MAG: hypothetical protein LBC40_01470 [Dysgonamonadaceae bacterium]|jgi:lysozyme|nr:hypothetical protein [Dysgonamonadaceae bacterium]